jgi:hypothetical protein
VPYSYIGWILICKDFLIRRVKAGSTTIDFYLFNIIIDSSDLREDLREVNYNGLEKVYLGKQSPRTHKSEVGPCTYVIKSPNGHYMGPSSG